MRKAIVILLALFTGFIYCSSGAVVLAEENGEKLAEAEKNNEEKSIKDNEGKEGSVETERTLDVWREKNQEAVKEEADGQETSEMKNLQIPQKLDVVIDPWEIDMKGQVYSETYIIRNIGKASGILTFSHLSCRPREQSGVVVRTDKIGLHDSGDKAIYMEMLFGNGEQIIFSPENSQYQIELMPGEELSVCFAGEVNENAFGKWENNDITVSVVYSWEMGEAISDTNLEESEGQEGLDEEAEKSIDTEKLEIERKPQGEVELEVTEGESQDNSVLDNNEQKSNGSIEDAEGESSNQAGDTVLQNQPLDINPNEGKSLKVLYPEGDIPSENSAEACIEDIQTSGDSSKAESIEKDEAINIELQDSQKVEVIIDSWKLDEKERIVSPQYILYNVGDTAGVWSLSELSCKPVEGCNVIIVEDKKRLQVNVDKSVYMELILGNGNKLLLSQKDSQYKVELKPGEKLSVRFVGEINGNLFETQEDGEVAVTAVSTWNIGEVMS